MLPHAAKKTSYATVMTAAFGVTARASAQLVALVVMVLAARFLAPAEFGIFSLAAACVILVRNMLYSGGYEYLMKCSAVRDASTECLVLNALIAATLSMVLVAVAFAAGLMFGFGSLILVLFALVPSNIFAVLATWQEAQILRGGRIRAFYGASLAGDAISGLVAIALLWAGWGVWSLVVQSYVRAFLLSIFYAAIARPQFSDNFSRHKMQEIAHWSLSRYGSVTLSFLSNYAADFLLGVFLSPAATGIYRAASRVVMAVSDLFMHPAQTFGATLFSKRAALGLSPDDLWPKLLTAWMVLAWPALVGLSVSAGLLIPLLFGPKWALAAPVVSILCLRQIWATFGAITSTLLVAFDHQRMVLHVQVVTMAVAIAALAVFARYGVIAAAASLTLTASLGNALLLYLTLRRFPGARHEFGRAVLTVLAVTIATGFGAQCVFGLEPWALPDGGMLAAIVAGGLFFWLASALIFRQRIIRSIHAMAGG